MKLELYSKDNKLLSKVDNDDAIFGSYPVDDGCRLHVSVREKKQKQKNDIGYNSHE